MQNEFEREIRDPNLSVVLDLSHKNRPLLIAFGGIYGALGTPPFEFFNLAGNLDINKIFLRDLSQTWYHSGLPGISKNIDETASYLKRKIDETGAKRVVVAGNSMGGYAAILFGILVKADIVHAFSAQTSISDVSLVRNKEQIRNTHDTFSSKYFDLNDTIKLYNPLGEFNLYYDVRDELDKKHATHLKGLRNMTPHSFTSGGHSVVKELRESGKLQSIITSSFLGLSKKCI